MSVHVLLCSVLRVSAASASCVCQGGVVFCWQGGSGAPGGEADDACAKAGIDAIQADLEATDAKEVGRIVYLSIPPKAYENASRAVAEHAHPSNRPGGDPLEDMMDGDDEVNNYYAGIAASSNSPRQLPAQLLGA